MPSIVNPALSVTTNLPDNHANVQVTCDVQFTEVEVNAMNLLGLTYTLSCDVLNEDMLDENDVLTFEPERFPRVPRAGRYYEPAQFHAYTPIEPLHERLIGKDKLYARLTLRNDETNDSVVERTDQLAVDLAA